MLSTKVCKGRGVSSLRKRQCCSGTHHATEELLACPLHYPCSRDLQVFHADLLTRKTNQRGQEKMWEDRLENLGRNRDQCSGRKKLWEWGTYFRNGEDNETYQKKLKEICTFNTKFCFVAYFLSYILFNFLKRE